MKLRKLKSFAAFVLTIVLTMISLSGCTISKNSGKTSKNDPSENAEYVVTVFIPENSEVFTSSNAKVIKTILSKRLKEIGISDCKIDIDKKAQTITVKFPKPGTRDDCDSEQISDCLAAKGNLEFYEGVEKTGEPFMTDEDVKKASAQFKDDYNTWVVDLKFTEEGTDAFYEATANAAENGMGISIYLDDECILSAACNQAIPDGEAIIYGNFTESQAKCLAAQINSGPLPFTLEVESTTGDD
ncbi:MAG: hypothetical protein J5766_03465 [Clostridia bacterium]|nr:hypothetical protein [Clostridia bacterium]